MNVQRADRSFTLHFEMRADEVLSLIHASQTRHLLERIMAPEADVAKLKER